MIYVSLLLQFVVGISVNTLDYQVKNKSYPDIYADIIMYILYNGGLATSSLMLGNGWIIKTTTQYWCNSKLIQDSLV